MSKTVGHIATPISKDTSSIEITQLLGDYNIQEFMQINMQKIIYLNCGETCEDMTDIRSYTHN